MFVLAVLCGILRPPTLELTRAAARGDLAALRRVLESNALDTVDLDNALVIAASFNNVECMGLLEEKNAGGGMEEALLQASLRDNALAVRWLISKERVDPAKNLEAASKLASGSSALICEWILFRAMRGLH